MSTTPPSGSATTESELVSFDSALTFSGRGRLSLKVSSGGRDLFVIDGHDAHDLELMVIWRHYARKERLQSAALAHAGAVVEAWRGAERPATFEYSSDEALPAKQTSRPARRGRPPR